MSPCGGNEAPLLEERPTRSPPDYTLMHSLLAVVVFQLLLATQAYTEYLDCAIIIHHTTNRPH